MCTTSDDACNDMGCGLKFCQDTCCAEGTDGTWTILEVSSKCFFTCGRCAREQELIREMDEVADSVEMLETDVDAYGDADLDADYVDVDEGLDVQMEEHLNMRQQLDE